MFQQLQAEAGFSDTWGAVHFVDGPCLEAIVECLVELGNPTRQRIGVVGDEL